MARKSMAVMMAILGLPGCADQSPISPSVSLDVYVVAGLEHELVDITIDGIEIYAGTIGAQPLSGPAVALFTSQDRGAHRLHVRVGELEATADLFLTAPSYALIERDVQTQVLRVTVTRDPPLWI